jgi:hypothetical protein
MMPGMETRRWPVRALAVGSVLLAAGEGSGQARTFRRGIDGRTVVPSIGDDARPWLELPSPFCLRSTPGTTARREVEPFGDDR